MTLRGKTLAILGVTLVALFAVFFLVLRYITVESFTDLEDQQVTVDVGRAENAMAAEVERVDSVVGDWAPWDDTWMFVRGEYADYPDVNLDASTLANLGVNFMLFMDADDRVYHATAADLESWEEAEPPAGLIEL